MKKLLPLMIGITLGSVAPFTQADDLLQIYDQAKKSDPILLQALANRDSAFAAINISRANLLPQINLTAGYNLSRNSEASIMTGLSDTNSLTAGLSLNQQIYNRASWLNLDLAEINARQADASYAAQQQNLMIRVASAYFDVLRAIDNLAFTRAEKAAVGRQLEQTKQRFDVGLSAITDVHDAQAQYDSVLAKEIIAENTLANSYEGIREITGQQARDLSVLNTKTFSASRPSSTVDKLITQAEEQNLQLLASRISRDASKESIDIAKSGHLPTLGLSAGYNYLNQDNQTNALADLDYNQLSAGVNFALPIYSGGSVSASVKQAQFNYVAASEALENTYRSTMKDVRAYFNNINANIGAVRAYEQTVISAKSALDATEAGFEVGTRTIVDVLDATRNLFNANSNLATARYDYIISELQLRQAVGSLTEQDLMDINKGLMPASTTKKTDTKPKK